MALGAGSNLVVNDSGCDGHVLHIQTRGVTVKKATGQRVHIHAEAGEDWDSFVSHTLAQGVRGLETLSGIPGTVGAAPIQNIGAYGHEVSEFITRVRTYDRQAKALKTFTNKECEFSYRNSHFKSHPGRYVVLDVGFQLRIGEMTTPIIYSELAMALGVAVGEKAQVRTCREKVLELRSRKGMLLTENDHDSWSAGSFFTNPIISSEVSATLPADAPRWPQADGQIKTSAAWLIENSGITKGQSIGGARISTKHVLALTNSGGAKASEIAALAKLAQEKVLTTFNISLELEVNVVGPNLL
jgi:UDP-N-acetylmuramate dehydrogenase